MTQAREVRPLPVSNILPMDLIRLLVLVDPMHRGRLFQAEGNNRHHRTFMDIEGGRQTGVHQGGRSSKAGVEKGLRRVLMPWDCHHRTEEEVLPMVLLLLTVARILRLIIILMAEDRHI